MSTPDHEANVEKLTELLEVKDERIAELQAEVEQWKQRSVTEARRNLLNGNLKMREKEKVRRRDKRIDELDEAHDNMRTERGYHLEQARQWEGNAIDAEKRVEELEAENARLHQLYGLDRAEHNSRGGA